MRASDLDFAAECARREGWESETRAEFVGFFEHDPHGCVLLESNAQRAGICVATAYRVNGFIGELIVDAQFRGLCDGAPRWKPHGRRTARDAHCR